VHARCCVADRVSPAKRRGVCPRGVQIGPVGTFLSAFVGCCVRTRVGIWINQLFVRQGAASVQRVAP
jgi:hypothetical protein